MQALEASDEVQVDLSRRYTLEEFWELSKREDGARYELIDGYLYTIPPPDPQERELAARMAKALIRFLDANNIDGEVHFPPEAIYRRAEGSTDLDPD